jgi:hypothetical protein
MSVAKRFQHGSLRKSDQGGVRLSSSQPKRSRALRATSGLGVFAGGNLSRQWKGRHASITATEWVMSRAARFSGGKTDILLPARAPNAAHLAQAFGIGKPFAQIIVGYIGAEVAAVAHIRFLDPLAATIDHAAQIIYQRPLPSPIFYDGGFSPAWRIVL